MTFTFDGPDRYLDPADLSEVIGLVRARGADYWNSNSGESSLLWTGPQGERRLTLYFLGREGFHLVFRQPDGRRVAAVPATPPARPKWIDIPVGGNPKRISSGQAVGRRDAMSILTHFAKTGEPDPRYAWQPVRWPEMG